MRLDVRARSQNQKSYEARDASVPMTAPTYQKGSCETQGMTYSTTGCESDFEKGFIEHLCYYLNVKTCSTLELRNVESMISLVGSEMKRHISYGLCERTFFGSAKEAMTLWTASLNVARWCRVLVRFCESFPRSRRCNFDLGDGARHLSCDARP
jgi:hypothetical protein